VALLPKQRSFLEVSEEHHTSLLAYIDRLRTADLKFPGHLGKVNKTAVARACGFSREVFQQNLRFSITLEEAVKTIGIEVPQVELPEPRNTSDKATILRLEQQLSALRSENYELRRRLRRYEVLAEHMANTGRRVPP
jgi:hypothetical protein